MPRRLPKATDPGPPGERKSYDWQLGCQMLRSLAILTLPLLGLGLQLFRVERQG